MARDGGQTYEFTNFPLAVFVTLNKDLRPSTRRLVLRPMGLFYLANPTSAVATVQVNGLAVAPARPSSSGPQPPLYTPYFVVAQSQREIAPGTIGQGENCLAVVFEDSITPRDPFTFGFTVPAKGWSIDDNLIAYAFRGQLMLMTPRGTALAPNPLLIPADPPVAARVVGDSQT